eukprot:COSAG06_NODE_48044_length_335_cov_0.605932_1_plen_81_part_10
MRQLLLLGAAAAAATATLAGGEPGRLRFEPSGASVTNPMRGFRMQIDGLCGDPKDGGHAKGGDPTGAKAVAQGLATCRELN